jgi:hypothetical protein
VAAEEQLLGLLHFLLPLNFDFVHNRIPWVICVGGSHRGTAAAGVCPKSRRDKSWILPHLTTGNLDDLRAHLR